MAGMNEWMNEIPEKPKYRFERQWPVPEVYKSVWCYLQFYGLYTRKWDFVLLKIATATSLYLRDLVLKMYQNTMGKRKANDKPVAPTTSKKWYSVAEACAKILDCDAESLQRNDSDLYGVDWA